MEGTVTEQFRLPASRLRAGSVRPTLTVQGLGIRWIGCADSGHCRSCRTSSRYCGETGPLPFRFITRTAIPFQRRHDKRAQLVRTADRHAEKTGPSSALPAAGRRAVRAPVPFRQYGQCRHRLIAQRYRQRADLSGPKHQHPEPPRYGQSSAVQWREVVGEFGRARASCGAEGELVMDHVVPINKQTHTR